MIHGMPHWLSTFEGSDAFNVMHCLVGIIVDNGMIAPMDLNRQLFTCLGGMMENLLVEILYFGQSCHFQTFYLFFTPSQFIVPVPNMVPPTDRLIVEAFIFLGLQGDKCFDMALKLLLVHCCQHVTKLYQKCLYAFIQVLWMVLVGLNKDNKTKYTMCQSRSATNSISKLFQSTELVVGRFNSHLVDQIHKHSGFKGFWSNHIVVLHSTVLLIRINH
mmetsp:Transcript_5179/g.32492  ORF Transcript_5179/g.32492 Transcript_5179/m.32492 type:complete len:217 (-) Transcript_5179:2552-3202(-)